VGNIGLELRCSVKLEGRAPGFGYGGSGWMLFLAEGMAHLIRGGVV
jgi:hypothetical protein